MKSSCQTPTSSSALNEMHPACARMRLRAVMGIVCVLGLLTQTTLSQDGLPRKEESLGGFLIAPDRVFEEMAKGLTKHYSLSDEQTEIVRQLVAEHGRRFVSKHADELRGLQMEGIKWAVMGGVPDPDSLKELSRRVKALLSDARGPIQEFGDALHEVLDDDQKARHAIERQQVRLLMDVVDLELDKMIMTGRLPGPDQSRPSSPGGTLGDGLNQARRRFSGAGFMEQQWEAYTKSFQAHYRLDADQIRRSEEMLSLAKKDAAEYRKANEAKIKEFSNRYASLRDGLRDRSLSPAEKEKLDTERKALDAQAAEFEAPLQDIFEQLKDALDLLPTEEQKTKYKEFPLRKLGAAKRSPAK